MAVQSFLRYEEALPEEFLSMVRRVPVFIVPAGLLEWHADHLPLGQDALKAYGVCARVAQKLGGGILLPPIYFGRPGFSSYVGTLTFSEPLMSRLFLELFAELKKVGARIIALVTGHYGPCQVDLVKKVASEFNDANHDTFVLAMPEYEDSLVDGVVPADHAGKWETSMFWSLYPKLTHMENFRMETSKKRYYDNPPNPFYDEKEEWTWKEDLRDAASPELGSRTVEVISDTITSKIRAKMKEMGVAPQH